MACEFKLNPKRVLHIAKSFPFVVFTLCVYILIGAAIYLRIGDTYEVYQEYRDLEVHSSLSSNNTSGNKFPIQYEDEDTNPWHYWESLFFIVTTLTTIGMSIFILVVSMGVASCNFYLYPTFPYSQVITTEGRKRGERYQRTVKLIDKK